MTRVERLEKEIAALSPEELEDFRGWFREFDAADWDKQIEADARAGRLDKLADAAIREHESGGSKEL